ncbi:MAG TPA: hypothetical protein VGA13_05190 [Acidimicrobiales bacterium]|jgi:hypothetical protein
MTRRTTLARLTSRHRYQLPLGSDALWDTLNDLDRYQGWWPWLQSFDARSLSPGEVWHCKVRPPLPYVVRFTLTLGTVVPRRRITATVAGDIVGSADLEIIDTADGCDVELASSLAPGRQWFRLLATAAGPLARRGHDWVLNTGAAQFIGHIA